MPVRDLVVTLIGKDETGDAFDSAGGRASKLKGVFAAGGAAAGVALVGGLVKNMDIQGANAHLAAQLGLTAEQSGRYGKIAADLYKGNYGDSIEGVNEGIGAVVTSISGMRDASNEAVEDMAKKALNLASAFDVEVGRAAQVAGQMITSGLAKDGAQAMDLLTASMQRVPAAVREDVLDAVDEYGPFMRSLGLQGEQAMGLLVAATQKGAFGIDKTGDALKEFTIRATDMSDASQVGFDAIGLSQEAMTKKLLAGGPAAEKAFTQIVTGLQKIKDPAKQSQAALALFGTPLEDLNVSEIPKFLASLTGTQKALGKTAGAADAMDATLSKGARASLESLRRQAEMAFVAFSNKALPALTDTAAFVSRTFGPALQGLADVLSTKVLPAVRSVFDFIGDHQTTFTVVAALIGTVLVPALIAMGVQATISGAKVVAAWTMQQLAAARTMVAVAVSYAATAAGWVFMGAQAMASAARIAAAWLISIGPIALVVAAVVGLGVLVVKNWDRIVGATTAVKDWIVGRFNDVVGFLRRLPGRVWGAVTGLFDGPRGLADSAVRWVARRFDDLIGFVTGIPGRIWDATRGMFDGIPDAFKSAMNWVLEKWNSIDLSISVKVPGWVPKFGGKGFSVPDIFPDVPLLAKGGNIVGAGDVIVGDAGPEILTLPVGARVTPLREAASSSITDELLRELIDETRANTAAIREIRRADRMDARSGADLVGARR